MIYTKFTLAAIYGSVNLPPGENSRKNHWSNRCAAMLASLFISFQIGSYTTPCWLAGDPKVITHVLASNHENVFGFLPEDVSRDRDCFQCDRYRLHCDFVYS